jgi:hypothetical protein
MPGDRHTVSARRAIYTENLVGDRVDMVDPGLVSHVPAPERHFALVGGAKPTQTAPIGPKAGWMAYGSSSPR